jgi:hypothetical protein
MFRSRLRLALARRSPAPLFAAPHAAFRWLLLPHSRPVPAPVANWCARLPFGWRWPS